MSNFIWIPPVYLCLRSVHMYMVRFRLRFFIATNRLYGIQFMYTYGAIMTMTLNPMSQTQSHHVNSPLIA